MFRIFFVLLGCKNPSLKWLLSVHLDSKLYLLIRVSCIVLFWRLIKCCDFISVAVRATKQADRSQAVLAVDCKTRDRHQMSFFRHWLFPSVWLKDSQFNAICRRAPTYTAVNCLYDKTSVHTDSDSVPRSKYIGGDVPCPMIDASGVYPIVGGGWRPFSHNSWSRPSRCRNYQWNSAREREPLLQFALSS